MIKWDEYILILHSNKITWMIKEQERIIIINYLNFRF